MDEKTKNKMDEMLNDFVLWTVFVSAKQEFSHAHKMLELATNADECDRAFLEFNTVRRMLVHISEILGRENCEELHKLIDDALVEFCPLFSKKSKEYKNE